MKPDDLNELPDWDDDDFDDEDNDGEGWKSKPTRDACKAMYQQWNTVMTVLKAAFDSLKTTEDDELFSKEMMEDHVGMIMGDAYQVAVKIKSSEAGGLYIMRMENAAIIRKNAQFIKISTNSFMLEGMMEPQHRLIIRDEIDTFKELFKTWVASFVKDDCEDEWGLFV